MNTTPADFHKRKADDDDMIVRCHKRLATLSGFVPASTAHHIVETHLPSSPPPYFGLKNRDAAIQKVSERVEQEFLLPDWRRRLTDICQQEAAELKVQILCKYKEHGFPSPQAFVNYKYGGINKTLNDILRQDEEASKHAPLHPNDKQKLMELARVVVDFYCDNPVGASLRLPPLDVFWRKVLRYLCDDVSILALLSDLSAAVLKHDVSAGNEKWMSVTTLHKELP